MHFIVHCLDHCAPSHRLQHYDAHKAYLATARVMTLISGPLLANDGQTMIGSFFLVEADDISDVIAFNQADPFYKAGVWGSINIHPFLKRIDNREVENLAAGL